MKKRILVWGLGLVLGMVALLVVRALRLTPSDFGSFDIPKSLDISIDEKRLAEKLSGAIQCITISHHDPTQNETRQWRKLRRWIERSFPQVHQNLVQEVFQEHSLLYTWVGSDPQLKPVLFLAHQDVVPVSPGTEKDWAHPPFSGAIEGGFVWGRGTIDDKSSVITLLESVESLIRLGYRPKRTLLFAFGHDEEVGGEQGAKTIASALRARGVKAELVLDEGGIIADGVMSDIPAPIAFVGIAEKGYVTIEMTAKAKGGHSSMPPARTAIGVLSGVIQRLETHPMPARLQGPVKQMLLTLGPQMSFLKRLAIANGEFFAPILLSELAKEPSTNALIRTTAAPTVFHSGEKDNVLPVEAKAKVNFRVIPGETSQTVIEHFRKLTQEDGVAWEATVHGEPSAISDTDTQGYRQLKSVVERQFPKTIVSAYLTLGGTDTKHFSGISSQIFRFLPQRMGPEDLNRFHGTNERVSLKSLQEMVRFYADFIQVTSAH